MTQYKITTKANYLKSESKVSSSYQCILTDAQGAAAAKRSTARPAAISTRADRPRSARRRMHASPVVRTPTRPRAPLRSRSAIPSEGARISVKRTLTHGCEAIVMAVVGDDAAWHTQGTRGESRGAGRGQSALGGQRGERKTSPKSLAPECQKK